MTVKNEPKFWVRNSVTIKSIIIGVLILVLLIPAGMIKNLIHERNSLRNSVVSEVSYKWGNPQTIAGPIITIPYKTYYKKDKEIIEKTNYAQFLPETLNVEGAINPEIRYRGIYKVVVYNANLNFSGNFNKPASISSNIKIIKIFKGLWAIWYMSLVAGMQWYIF